MTRSRYRSSPTRIALLLAVLSVPLSEPVRARTRTDEFSTAAAEFVGDGSPRAARDVSLPPIGVPFELGSLEDALLIRCSVQATLDGKPRKAVTVNLEGELVDEDGETVGTFGMSGKTTRKNAGWTSPFTFTPDSLVKDIKDGRFLALVQAKSGSGKDVDGMAVNCTAGRPSDCVGDATTGCLLGDRFKTQVDWVDPFDGSDRQALAHGINGSTINFDFLPLADELLVELLDACHEPFGRYWVFFAAETDVDFTLTVTDTATGLSREYGPPDPPLRAITDTQAFATCP